VARLIADRLRHRARIDGGAPLITYYDLQTGERTELSATSFLNWVDKASNLLADEYLLGTGGVVDLDLANSAPGHWVTLLIELAVWQVGATARVVTAAEEPADLLVLGPDWQSHDHSRADAVLACSLHPMGLGFAGGLPSGVADFSLEVRGQSDFYPAAPQVGLETAWVDDVGQRSQLDLVADPIDSRRLRRLVRPTSPWEGARDAVILPILTGGSTVVVVGDDAERLVRIAETERVDQDHPAGTA
jgi:uncharacterized protein (TIGR03089 family)